MKNIKPFLGKLWKVWMWLCTFAVTVPLVALIGLLLVDPFFFQIDSCLDAGGRWNDEINKCEKLL
ncbi:MAG: hypothetical protein KBC88_05450 [Alphaproteobacteria bacterium]|jgi:hypothetical protein|nr:hypothetical protein [Alphaproteobacteria bacterium]MBP9868358.1 hypothetical protein [Alphaproteobacteria bacterium]